MGETPSKPSKSIIYERCQYVSGIYPKSKISQEDNEQMDIVKDKQRGCTTLNHLKCFTYKENNIRAELGLKMLNRYQADTPDMLEQNSMKLLKFGLNNIVLFILYIKHFIFWKTKNIKYNLKYQFFY